MPKLPIQHPDEHLPVDRTHNGRGLALSLIALLAHATMPNESRGGPAIDAGISQSQAHVVESITGPQSGSDFGRGLAGAGDVTGDDIPDVLVGAPLAGTSQQGAVYLYPGMDHSLGKTPVWTAVGSQNGARFGASVAGGSDINGDTFFDVVIGAPDHDGVGADAGRVFVYLGTTNGLPAAPSQVLDGSMAGARFGHALAFVGDVNGDGKADVLVGEPDFANGQTHEGRARLFAGSDGGLQPTEIWMTEGDEQGAAYGRALAGAGDVNGDGLSDFAIGAPNALAGRGRVSIFHGALGGPSTTATTTLAGPLTPMAFASAIAGVGDFNGDNYSDLAVGCPLANLGGGSIRLYLGSATGVLTPPLKYPGPNPSMLGVAVASAGDLNMDGYADFAAGAPDYRVFGMRMGRLFVFYGSPTPSLEDPVEIDGSPWGMEFGSSLAPSLDANYTCVSDLLVGTRAGKVALVDGDNPCANACIRPSAPTLLGPSDGAPGQPTTVTMTWEEVPGVVAYRLKLTCATGRPVPGGSQTVYGTSYSTTLEPATYTWYVQAYSNCGPMGFPSPVWTFTVGAGSICRVPVLTSPADAANCIPTTGTLTWDPLPGASGYVLELSRRCGSTDLVAQTTQPSYDVAGLMEGETYSWRVREDCPCAPFSECASFRTITEPLRQPRLAAPASNAEDQPASGLLMWNEVHDAVGYRVQIGTACGTGPEVDVGATTYGYGPLQESTAYYWRVAARDVCGTYSAYSDCRSFSTDQFTGINRVYLPSDLVYTQGQQSVLIPIHGENLLPLRRYRLRLRPDRDVFEVIGWTLQGTRSEGALIEDVAFSRDNIDADISMSNGPVCPLLIPPGAGLLIYVIVNVRSDAVLGPTGLDFPPSQSDFWGCLDEGHTGAANQDGFATIIEGPVASAAVPVTGPAFVEFTNAGEPTNVSLDFSLMAGTGSVTVDRYPGPATDVTFAGSAPVDTGTTRWVITESGISPLMAQLRIGLSGLPDAPALGSPIAIYHRESPGFGPFAMIPTILDPITNTVTATVTSFSEFILGTQNLVGVGPEPPTGDLLLRVRGPNPLRGDLVFDVTLGSGGEPAALDLFDVQGRRLRSVDLSRLGPGRYAVTLERAGRLPTGLYFSRLVKGNRHLTAKVVAIR